MQDNTFDDFGDAAIVTRETEKGRSFEDPRSDDDEEDEEREKRGQDTTLAMQAAGAAGVARTAAAKMFTSLAHVVYGNAHPLRIFKNSHLRVGVLDILRGTQLRSGDRVFVDSVASATAHNNVAHPGATSGVTNIADSAAKEALNNKKDATSSLWSALRSSTKRQGLQQTIVSGFLTPTIINASIGMIMFTTFDLVLRRSRKVYQAALDEKKRKAEQARLEKEAKHGMLRKTGRFMYRMVSGRKNKDEKLKNYVPPPTILPVQYFFLAGGTAGFVQASLACPFQNVAANYSRAHFCWRAALKLTWKRRELFHRMTRSSLTEAISMAVFFGSYEASKRSIDSAVDSAMKVTMTFTYVWMLAFGVLSRQFQDKKETAAIAPPELPTEAEKKEKKKFFARWRAKKAEVKEEGAQRAQAFSDKKKYRPVVVVASGLVSAVCYNAVVHPLSRATLGPREMFKGMRQNLIRGMPANAIGFIIYELGMREQYGGSGGSYLK